MIFQAYFNGSHQPHILSGGRGWHGGSLRPKWGCLDYTVNSQEKLIRVLGQYPPKH